MSQNIVALIIFLSLVALAVIGTLAFSALVDRSVKRERARTERRKTDYTDRSRAASQSDSTQSATNGGSASRESSGEESGSGNDSRDETERYR